MLGVDDIDPGPVDAVIEQLQHGEVTRQVFQLRIAFLRPAAVFFLPGAPDFF